MCNLGICYHSVAYSSLLRHDVWCHVQRCNAACPGILQDTTGVPTPVLSLPCPAGQPSQSDEPTVTEKVPVLWHLEYRRIFVYLTVTQRLVEFYGTFYVRG